MLLSMSQFWWFSGFFSEVTSDFTAELPYVLCQSADTHVTCRINLATVAACKTSQLLAKYAAIDPRVVQLGVVFRYWAKVSDTCCFFYLGQCLHITTQCCLLTLCFLIYYLGVVNLKQVKVKELLVISNL